MRAVVTACLASLSANISMILRENSYPMAHVIVISPFVFQNAFSPQCLADDSVKRDFLSRRHMGEFRKHNEKGVLVLVKIFSCGKQGAFLVEAELRVRLSHACNFR